MSEPAEFTRASFRIVAGAGEASEFEVHFNPASLQYTITNTMQEQGEDKKQHVSQSTGKLTMDLIFDTTGDGQDVRNFTTKVAGLMKPDEEERPPTVRFEWGAYSFQGLMESYRETIDFFSPGGVPLRAAINLTLVSQDKVFEAATAGPLNVGGSLEAEPLEMFVPKPLEGGTRGSPQDVASRAGVPGAARVIAAANGAESLRFASAGSLAVPGGRAAAGPRTAINLRKLARTQDDRGLATELGASFGVGGQARVQGAASLRADVGAGGSLHSRVRFEGA